MIDRFLPIGVAVVIASTVMMHVRMVYLQGEATSIFDVLSPSQFNPMSIDNSVEEYVLQDTLSKPLILSGNHLRVTYGTDMRTRILRFQGVKLADTDIFSSTQEEELFTVAFPDRIIKASDCTLVDAQTVTTTSVQVEFDCPLGTSAAAASAVDESHPPVFSLLWQASLTVLDYAEVLKIDIEFLRDSYASVVGADVTLFRLLMIEEESKSGGIGEQAQMPGIPLRGKHWWMSVEHPRAVNFRSLAQGVMTGSLVLSSREMRLSASFGVSLAPSLEIAFAQYVESFRPLKEPFMFYNSAYDLITCAAEPCPAERAPSKENVELLLSTAGTHGVLLNDGWDKTEGLPWEPSFDLPKIAANATGRGIGLWLSPTGGYRKTAHMAENSPTTRRNQRIYETILEGNKDSASDVNKEDIGTITARLSNPQYYSWLKKRLTTLKEEQGAAFFAMDKIDTLYKPEELDALLVLVKDLPLVLLMTEDLWASPWFLIYFHAIWRGGTDLGEAPDAASSSARLKMRTFRDMNIFKVHERSNGLFPLRRLVNNGVIWSSFAEGAQLPLYDAAASFTDEVDYYFAEGQLVKQILVDTRALSPKDKAYLQTRWDNAVPALRCFRHVQHIGADPSVNAYGLLSMDAHAKNGTFRIRNPMRTEVTMTISRQLLSLPLQWEYDVREIGGGTGRNDSVAGRIPLQVSLQAEQVRSFDLAYVSGDSSAGGGAEGRGLLWNI